MKYKFSNKSIEALKTCHKDLQLIMEEALSLSDMDFGVSQGYRSVETQKAYFNAGLTKLDGVKNLSKHNHLPSHAADIYAYVNDKVSYAERDLCYLAGVIMTASKKLKDEGKIDHSIRWGGNWDSDGVIITDQSFMDLPHFEII